MPIIEAKDLCKTYRVAAKASGLAGTLRHFFRRAYREIEAVCRISFRIEPGQIVGFLGPNGAGKTTTLKMLTGLVYPTSGSIRVAGFTPFDRRYEFLRKITLVMGQKQQLIWDLPAMDSLRINAAVYEIPTTECNRRLGELAEMLGLREQLTQPVRKLSLGERMKAELLAALLHRPEVLFLDEPTLGLDINAQAAVREFLRNYNQRYRATMLVTSHYMADITALCERVVVIHKGRLIFDGSLGGILDRFAPYRQVQVELEDPVPAHALQPYGTVERLEGRVALIIVRREALTETVGRLLRDLAVKDLTVTDPPIDNIIGRLFAGGDTP